MGSGWFDEQRMPSGYLFKISVWKSIQWENKEKFSIYWVVYKERGQAHFSFIRAAAIAKRTQSKLWKNKEKSLIYWMENCVSI